MKTKQLEALCRTAIERATPEQWIDALISVMEAETSRIDIEILSEHLLPIVFRYMDKDELIFRFQDFTGSSLVSVDTIDKKHELKKLVKSFYPGYTKEAELQLSFI